MDISANLILLKEFLSPFLNFALVSLLLVILWIYLTKHFKKEELQETGSKFRQQVTMLLVSLAGLIAVLISLPINNELRGQLFSLIGILLSAIIALSSTTIVGNIMAGLMLKAVGNFRIGDFIKVGEHFGRVSELGIMHTEIQNEERLLVTLPNTYLVSNTVSVMRTSGTIIHCDVSLGFDVSNAKVEEILLAAALDSDLIEPSVYIRAIGDFSVSYRVVGLLEDIKTLYTARSRLNRKVLNLLHNERIEIASPNMMNTRSFDSKHLFIPRGAQLELDDDKAFASTLLDTLAFDKAERAEGLERLKSRFKRNQQLIEECEGLIKPLEADDPVKSELEAKLKRLLKQNERLSLILKPESEEASPEKEES